MIRRIRLLLAPLFILLAVLLVGVLLTAISPWRQAGPIIKLRVGPDQFTTATFDSRALSCPEQRVSGEGSDQFQVEARCSIVIAGKELALRVEHEGIRGSCTAAYDGEALRCNSSVPFYNASVPAVSIPSDLGLDEATLVQLPGTNPLFAVPEQRWVALQFGLAVLITATAALIAGLPRLQLSRPFFPHATRMVSYALGALLVFAGVWFALMFALLSSGLVD